MSYKLKAGYNKVVTKVEKKEEVIKGGLILIEGASGNMVNATVIAAPPNDEVGVSDKVIFDKSKSVEITVEDIKYNVIDIRDILAILQIVKTKQSSGGYGSGYGTNYGDNL